MLIPASACLTVMLCTDTVAVIGLCDTCPPLFELIGPLDIARQLLQRFLFHNFWWGKFAMKCQDEPPAGLWDNPNISKSFIQKPKMDVSRNSDSVLSLPYQMLQLSLVRLLVLWSCFGVSRACIARSQMRCLMLLDAA